MRILWAIMTSLPLVLSACSSDDGAKTEEPVAPLSDDAAAVPAPDAAATDGATPPSEAPSGEMATDPAMPPASETETVGELTESSSPAIPPPAPQAADEAPMPAESEMAPAPQSPRAKSGKGKAVTRVVTATKLNVRSGPSRKASVVRQLSKGEEVQAVMQGKFAKIGEGEYVRAKYLSPKGKGSKSKGKKGKKARAKKSKKSGPKAEP